MKKRTFQTMMAFLLVLSMQAAPLSYAAEPDSGAQQQAEVAEDVTVSEEDASSDTVDTPQDAEEPGSAVEAEDPDESEDPDAGTKPEEPEDPEEGEEPEEPETPVVPGETGTPGWYAQGSDWYYYDTNGAKATGWRYVNGSWYYLDGANAEKPGVMLASTRQVIDGQTYSSRRAARCAPAGSRKRRAGTTQAGAAPWRQAGSGSAASGTIWTGRTRSTRA